MENQEKKPTMEGRRISPQPCKKERKRRGVSFPPPSPLPLSLSLSHCRSIFVLSESTADDVFFLRSFPPFFPSPLFSRKALFFQVGKNLRRRLLVSLSLFLLTFAGPSRSFSSFPLSPLVPFPSLPRNGGESKEGGPRKTWAMERKEGKRGTEGDATVVALSRKLVV